MPSIYLQSTDYAQYGIANNANTSQLVTRASQIIDSFLKRPEGLIYAVDANNTPIYMQSPVASQTLTTTQSISPGKTISVTVTGASSIIQNGAVGILDIGQSSVEPVIVNSVTGNTIILYNVNNSHNSGATIQFGLLIDEQIDMFNNRPITKLSRCPVMNVIGGEGRYSYSRNNSAIQNMVDDINMLAIYSQFGGPPAWEPWTPTPSMWDINTGELWVPSGVMLSYFSQIRVHYVAGFTYANLPANIKQACANIINNIIGSPIGADIKSYRAGDTAIERYSNTLIDNDTRDLLIMYCARMFV